MVAVDDDEIRDILVVMKQQESTVYGRHGNDDELVALWRKMLIGWMYYVVDYCKLQRQSVAAAAFFYDVAVSHNLVESREDHQLAAATALQLSLKTFDTAVITSEKLVQLGRGLFTKSDIVDMEMKILKVMNWRIHPTSTYCFLRQYERLLPLSVSTAAKSTLQEITKLISELTVSDMKYNDVQCSVLAFASILLAMELIDCSDLHIHQRQCFVVRMSTVANIPSNSTLVLDVFESLKVTLDECDKLPALIESLDKASSTSALSVSSIRRRRKSTTPKATARKSIAAGGSSPKTNTKLSSKKTIITRVQSPRHVMQRVGSHSCLSR